MPSWTVGLAMRGGGRIRKKKVNCFVKCRQGRREKLLSTKDRSAKREKQREQIACVDDLVNKVHDMDSQRV